MPIIKKNDTMTPDLKRIQRELAEVPGQAHDFFVGVTPKASGNARRNTQLSGGKIQARYPYADKLDKGWSRQAPKGMIEPTAKYVQSLVKKILGR